MRIAYPGRFRVRRPWDSCRNLGGAQAIATAAAWALLLVAAGTFLWQAGIGLHAVLFGDEVMHLLGGRVLDGGATLYRGFVDLHGPAVFMLAQAYGAAFGWADPDGARLVPASLAMAAGVAVALSPAAKGARLAAAALFFGLMAAVWLLQGLYLFSHYTIAGAAFAVMLAMFVVPGWQGRIVAPGQAALGGAAASFAAFASFAWGPALVLLAGSGLWAAPQRAPFVLGAATAGAALLAWLLRFGSIPGYLAFHVGTSIAPLAQVGGGISLRKFADSLVPSLRPERLVQDCALACVVLAAGLALRPGLRGSVRFGPALLGLAGLVALDARGLTAFQDGTFLMAGIAALALTLSTAPGWRAPAMAAACILAAHVGLRHATGSPWPASAAEFAAATPNFLPRRSDAPLFRAIRDAVRPGEPILALVYTPDIYWLADRLPMRGFYTWLPTDAIYARAPLLGQAHDLCSALAQEPPPAITFDDWKVWDAFAPADYMPCVLDILHRSYRQSAAFPVLWIRADRS